MMQPRKKSEKIPDIKSSPLDLSKTSTIKSGKQLTELYITDPEHVISLLRDEKCHDLFIKTFEDLNHVLDLIYFFKIDVSVVPFIKYSGLIDSKDKFLKIKNIYYILLLKPDPTLLQSIPIIAPIGNLVNEIYKENKLNRILLRNNATKLVGNISELFAIFHINPEASSALLESKHVPAFITKDILFEYAASKDPKKKSFAIQMLQHMPLKYIKFKLSKEDCEKLANHIPEVFKVIGKESENTLLYYYLDQSYPAIPIQQADERLIQVIDLAVSEPYRSEKRPILSKIERKIHVAKPETLSLHALDPAISDQLRQVHKSPKQSRDSKFLGDITGRYIAHSFMDFSSYIDVMMFSGTSGYYSSGNVDFKKDFVTFASSPKTEKPFAAGFAYQLLLCRRHLISEKKLQPDDPFNVLEGGAGNGNLCFNILNTIKKMAESKEPEDETQAQEWKKLHAEWQDLYRTISYHIIERSPELAKIQSEKNKQFIQESKLTIVNEDAKNLAKALPDKKMAVVISNELLDVFPPHQVTLKSDGHFYNDIVVPAIPKKDLFRLVLDPHQQSQLVQKSKYHVAHLKELCPKDEDVTEDTELVFLETKDFLELHRIQLEKQLPCITTNYGHIEYKLVDSKDSLDECVHINTLTIIEDKESKETKLVWYNRDEKKQEICLDEKTTQLVKQHMDGRTSLHIHSHIVSSETPISVDDNKHVIFIDLSHFLLRVSWIDDKNREYSLTLNSHSSSRVKRLMKSTVILRGSKPFTDIITILAEDCGYQRMSHEDCFDSILSFCCKPRFKFFQFNLNCDFYPELKQFIKDNIEGFTHLSLNEKELVCLSVKEFMKQVSSILIDGGEVISVDYGNNAYQRNKQLRTYHGNPLSIRQSSQVKTYIVSSLGFAIFNRPGREDITYDVNFSDVVKQGEICGLTLVHFGKQTDLLPLTIYFPEDIVPKASCDDFIEQTKPTTFQVCVQRKSSQLSIEDQKLPCMSSSAILTPRFAGASCLVSYTSFFQARKMYIEKMKRDLQNNLNRITGEKFNVLAVINNEGIFSSLDSKYFVIQHEKAEVIQKLKKILAAESVLHLVPHVESNSKVIMLPMNTFIIQTISRIKDYTDSPSLLNLPK